MGVIMDMTVEPFDDESFVAVCAFHQYASLPDTKAAAELASCPVCDAEQDAQDRRDWFLRHYQRLPWD